MIFENQSAKYKIMLLQLTLTWFSPWAYQKSVCIFSRFFWRRITYSIFIRIRAFVLTWRTYSTAKTSQSLLSKRSTLPLHFWKDRSPDQRLIHDLFHLLRIVDYPDLLLCLLDFLLVMFSQSCSHLLAADLRAAVFAFVPLNLVPEDPWE